MSATSYAAGAQIPITRTFVQGTVTTAIGLVGQVLDNGQTNWVGVDNGRADYLLTASAANAQQTTLADGRTYYYSSGSAPAGYLYLTGSQTASAASSSHTGSSGTGASSGTAATGGAVTTGTSSHATTTMPASSSRSGSAAAASTATTTTSSAHKLSSGAIFSIGLALLATLSLNVLA